MSLPPPPSAQPFSMATAYGVDPRWMAPAQHGQPRVRSLRGLSIALNLLFPLLALLAVVVAFVLGSRAQAGERFLDRQGPFMAVDDAGLVFGFFVGLLFIGTSAAGVVMIVWQFRHARNAVLLGGPLGLDPGWAIGGWAISCVFWAFGQGADVGREAAVVLWLLPFLGVLLPACQLFQADRASDPALPSGTPGRRGRGSRVIVVWALAFGTGYALCHLGRLLFPSDVVGGGHWAGDAVDGDRLMAAGYLVVAVTALLALAMVRALTRRQEMRAAIVFGVWQAQGFPPYLAAGTGAGAGAVPVPGPPAPPRPFVPGPGPVGLAGQAYPTPVPAAAVPVPVPGFPVPAGGRMWGAWLAAAVMSVAFLAYGSELGTHVDDYGRVRTSNTDGNDIAASSGGGDLVAPASLAQLDVGDCFDDSQPIDSGRVGRLTIVDCDDPHDHEVFAIERMRGGDSYPGQGELVEQANDKCSEEAFERYVGTDFATSLWFIGWYGPDASQWEHLNYRKVICVLYAPDQTKLVGSKRDTGT